MKIFQLSVYHIVYWSGQINDDRCRLDTFYENVEVQPFHFHTAMVANKEWNRIFCCTTDGDYSVAEHRYVYNEKDRTGEWAFHQSLANYENYKKEMLLQMKLDPSERMLLGTSGKGFIIWDFDEENPIGEGAMYLPLPHGVRNISTKMMTSNSFMVSSKLDFAVAGVRFVLKMNAIEGRFVK